MTEEDYINATDLTKLVLVAHLISELQPRDKQHPLMRERGKVKRQVDEWIKLLADQIKIDA